MWALTCLREDKCSACKGEILLLWKFPMTFTVTVTVILSQTVFWSRFGPSSSWHGTSEVIPTDQDELILLTTLCFCLQECFEDAFDRIPAWVRHPTHPRSSEESTVYNWMCGCVSVTGFCKSENSFLSPLCVCVCVTQGLSDGPPHSHPRDSVCSQPGPKWQVLWSSGPPQTMVTLQQLASYLLVAPQKELSMTMLPQTVLVQGSGTPINVGKESHETVLGLLALWSNKNKRLSL